MQTLFIVLMPISVLFFLGVNAVLIAKNISFCKYVAGFFLSAVPMSICAMYLGGVFG